MARSIAALLVVITALAVCSIAGGYGSMFMASKNGLFLALRASIGAGVEQPYIPGAQFPFLRRYTGVRPIDRQLAALVGFFSSLFDGEKGVEVTLSALYLVVQFGAAWALLALEGLRNGNRGRAVSWTGTMGFIMQNITFTVTAPIYLIIHLLTSPASTNLDSSPEAVLVDTLDLKILPVATFFSYIIPTVLMNLSSSVLPGNSHYWAVALWQPFPLYQSIIHWALKRFAAPFGRQIQTTGRAYRNVLGWTYKFILSAPVLAHLTILGISLTPASVFPKEHAALLSRATFSSIFVPRSLLVPPTINPTLTPIPADGLAPLALFFLQWDVYFGCLSILLWASYVSMQSSRGGNRSLLMAKILFWLVVGGPIAPSVALLWERDEWAVSTAAAEEKRRKA